MSIQSYITEAKRRHICEICSKPVYLREELQPVVPHHWSCWEKLSPEQMDYYTKLGELRRGYE